MIQYFNKIDKVSGTLTLQGDKSISHRIILISSLAKGKSFIRNLPDSEDIISTIECVKRLGIQVKNQGNDTIIYGRGFKGFVPPEKSLYAGNSGTTARLLIGILSAQDFESEILGDTSLSIRPMKRIIEPLSLMGCKIKSKGDMLPILINPTNVLKPIDYELKIASAQVKSAVLFAGLHLDVKTSVIEFIQTRNHTENLLDLSVQKDDRKIKSLVSSSNYPEPKEYFIPGDVSSAMFFIVLALLTKNSELIIKNVCLNNTRIECINILKRMGGIIQIEQKGVSNNEIFGDIVVKSSLLSNVNIDEDIIPLLIDEIPIITIAGVFAEGGFQLKGASELRVKESDRIKAICANLLKLGLNVEEFDDGFCFTGDINKLSEPFESFGDHRIAMAFSILSSLLDNGGNVKGIESTSISNPEFLNQLRSIIV
jgi:3-phosphoshikimate 1-carboxyvinyltransferase